MKVFGEGKKPSIANFQRRSRRWQCRHGSVRQAALERLELGWYEGTWRVWLEMRRRVRCFLRRLATALLSSQKRPTIQGDPRLARLSMSVLAALTQAAEFTRQGIEDCCKVCLSVANILHRSYIVSAEEIELDLRLGTTGAKSNA